MNIKQVLALTLIALQLGGCSSMGGKPSDADQTAVVETRDPANDVVTGGVGTVDKAPEMPVNIVGLDAPMEKVLYFDFDRSDIRADQRAVIDTHVRYLLTRPGLQVRLEGHADERGSREYNLALGERRAQAVHRYFNINGIATSRMTTLSYGEEYPVNSGHNESAWGQNRRVEIVYLSGGL